MALSSAQATHLTVSRLLDGLAEMGVQHICICPGSRSTPLAVLAVSHPHLRTWLHLDERSASFFALGIGKATGSPAAVIVTSGTAAANLLPATIEASQAHVPLLLLTADRPPELRGIGATQTIEQAHLFGSYVRLFVEMPVPDGTSAVLDFARATAQRAVRQAIGRDAGPVHINLPFREPLMPIPPDQADIPTPVHARQEPGVASGDDATGAAWLASALRTARRGMIVCGPQSDRTVAPAVYDVAKRLGMPVLADGLSGLRASPHPTLITTYDAFLRRPDTATWQRPDLILRLGDIPVSKSLTQYIQACDQATQIVISPQHAYSDATLSAAAVLAVSPAILGSPTLREHLPTSPINSDWLRVWQQREQATLSAIEAHLAPQPHLSEEGLFRQIALCLPPHITLMVGNSMPVRDLDTFLHHTPTHIHPLCNRGASGIDGVISTALGAAAAAPAHPLLLVMGDVSFYHDSNGLLAARRYPLNATIVLIHNDGGGIFSFLPQAAYPAHFEECFGTPHGLDFGPLVQMYGGRYHRPLTWPAFRSTLSESMQRPGLDVIAVVTDRTANVEGHRAVWCAVAAAPFVEERA